MRLVYLISNWWAIFGELQLPWIKFFGNQTDFKQQVTKLSKMCAENSKFLFVLELLAFFLFLGSNGWAPLSKASMSDKLCSVYQVFCWDDSCSPGRELICKITMQFCIVLHCSDKNDIMVIRLLGIFIIYNFRPIESTKLEVRTLIYGSFLHKWLCINYNIPRVLIVIRSWVWVLSTRICNILPMTHQPNSV